MNNNNGMIRWETANGVVDGSIGTSNGTLGQLQVLREVQEAQGYDQAGQDQGYGVWPEVDHLRRSLEFAEARIREESALNSVLTEKVEVDAKYMSQVMGDQGQIYEQDEEDEVYGLVSPEVGLGRASRYMPQEMGDKVQIFKRVGEDHGYKSGFSSKVTRLSAEVAYLSSEVAQLRKVVETTEDNLRKEEALTSMLKAKVQSESTYLSQVKEGHAKHGQQLVEDHAKYVHKLGEDHAKELKELASYMHKLVENHGKELQYSAQASQMMENHIQDLHCKVEVHCKANFDLANEMTQSESSLTELGTRYKSFVTLLETHLEEARYKVGELEVSIFLANQEGGKKDILISNLSRELQKQESEMDILKLAGEKKDILLSNLSRELQRNINLLEQVTEKENILKQEGEHKDILISNISRELQKNGKKNGTQIQELKSKLEQEVVAHTMEKAELLRIIEKMTKKDNGHQQNNNLTKLIKSKENEVHVFVENI